MTERLAVELAIVGLVVAGVLGGVCLAAVLVALAGYWLGRGR
jgi:hypothetical protein